MCTFVDRMVNIGVEQGIKVLVKTCQGLNVSKEKTKTQIADGFSISDEEAEKELEKYWS